MLIIVNDRSNLFTGCGARGSKRPGITAAPAPPHLCPVLSFLDLLAIDSFLKLLTPLKNKSIIIKQIFIECLWCAGPGASHWEYGTKDNRYLHSLVELTTC